MLFTQGHRFQPDVFTRQIKRRAEGSKNAQEDPEEEATRRTCVTAGGPLPGSLTPVVAPSYLPLYSPLAEV